MKAPALLHIQPNDIRQSIATDENWTAGLSATKRNSLANDVVAKSRSRDSAGRGLCVAQAAHWV